MKFTTCYETTTGERTRHTCLGYNCSCSLHELCLYGELTMSADQLGHSSSARLLIYHLHPHPPLRISLDRRIHLLIYCALTLCPSRCAATLCLPLSRYLVSLFGFSVWAPRQAPIALPQACLALSSSLRHERTHCSVIRICIYPSWPHLLSSSPPLRQ